MKEEIWYPKIMSCKEIDGEMVCDEPILKRLERGIKCRKWDVSIYLPVHGVGIRIKTEPYGSRY